MSRLTRRERSRTDVLATGSQAVRERSSGGITANCLADLLAMVGGFGCVISSMITLLVRTSYLSSLLFLTPLQIFFPRSYEHEAGYRYRERPMTELWSDDDEKSQLAGGMDDYYKPTTVYHDEFASRKEVQDRDPHAHRPSTPRDSSPSSNLKVGAATITYPQRRHSHPAARPAAPALDSRNHPYLLPDPTALRNPPPPRPEKSIARRSRVPVWEMVRTDEDEPQEYYVDGPDSDVARRDSSAGGTNLSRSRPSKSNLHPILRHYSSPISTCPFL